MLERQLISIALGVIWCRQGCIVQGQPAALIQQLITPSVLPVNESMFMVKGKDM
jgi:hypothetical protein